MPHTAYKDQHMISMLIGPPGNCSACPCVNMALSLLIHSQYICISTYIWFNVMYVILFSLCVYARLNKLEERGNEIQRYMQLYTKLFSPLNSTGARCFRKKIKNKKYYIYYQRANSLASIFLSRRVKFIVTSERLNIFKKCFHQSKVK